MRSSVLNSPLNFLYITIKFSPKTPIDYSKLLIFQHFCKILTKLCTKINYFYTTSDIPELLVANDSILNYLGFAKNRTEKHHLVHELWAKM